MLYFVISKENLFMLLKILLVLIKFCYMIIQVLESFYPITIAFDLDKFWVWRKPSCFITFWMNIIAYSCVLFAFKRLKRLKILLILKQFWFVSWHPGGEFIPKWVLSLIMFIFLVRKYKLRVLLRSSKALIINLN